MYKEAAMQLLGFDVAPEAKKEKTDAVKDAEDFKKYVKPCFERLRTKEIKPMTETGLMDIDIKDADNAIAIASLDENSGYGTVMEIITGRFIAETLNYGGTFEITRGSRGEWDVINKTSIGVVILTQVKASRDNMPAKLHNDDLKMLIAHGHKYSKLTNQMTWVAVMRMTGQVVLSFEVYACDD